jgi:hypothetical protein
MSEVIIPGIKSFVICRDVLVNSRNPSVISIINIFNELRMSVFPAYAGTICLVAIYGGAVGEFRHRFETWERDEKIGETPDHPFFLEDVNAMFHAMTYLDGIYAEEPKHLVFRAMVNNVEVGRTSLGIFKPLKDAGPPIPPLQFNTND